MTRSILADILKFALLLLAVSFVSFALISVSPIDPVQMNVGQAAYINMSEAKRAQLQEYWGVGTPLLERYAAWLAAALQGDLGTSLRFNAPVADVIGTRAVNSLALMACAWVASGALGFAMGVSSGAARGGAWDRFVKGYCFLLASTPTFWLGLLALMVFSVWLGWFPFGFSVPIGVSAADVTLADAARHMALPALTLSVVGVANIALHTREKTIDVMESDYVRFARARGLGTGVIVVRHGLRNVALPAITLQFASISEIFGGSVLVEQVFSYPGLGQAAVTAGLGGDAALLAGISVFSAALVFAGNLAANVVYGAVDPRMRTSRKGFGLVANACRGAKAAPAAARADGVLHLPRRSGGGRRAALVACVGTAACLVAVVAVGLASYDVATSVDFSAKGLGPCLAHPFGTDWMGRDMLARTLSGLSTSVLIGILAAGASSLAALALGTAAALGGKRVDAAVSWLIDLMLGLPHLVLLILISYAVGKGFWGVVVGVALTHWPSLARVVRAEVLQCRQSDYVTAARRLGKNRANIAAKHMLPAVFPQFVVGLLLLFPHAILHEASITFLGFGLPAEMPAVGVILSESMSYLSAGMWWLAVFPGAALVAVVLLFDACGGSLRKLVDPHTAQG